MSLKDARRIAKRARQAGRDVKIGISAVACDVLNPGRSRLCGDYIVVDQSVGQDSRERYIWD